jgi:predicted choloylglycine hydrolase
MKKSLLTTIALSIAAVILMSCGGNSKDFIGTWKEKSNNPKQLTIRKSGDNFIVRYYGFIFPAYEQSFTTTAELSGGSLILERNSDFPKDFSTKITYSSNAVFYNGDSYKKIK